MAGMLAFRARSVKRILPVVSSAPLVPGPLYGLRTWRVIIAGRAASGSPRRSAARRGRWAATGAGDVAARTTRAPAAGCGCGIHAWHPRRASARRILRSRFDLPGIVEADGAVEVHEEGFRAQRARPYAFVRLPGRNPFLIERLAAAYGAEVLDLRRPEELLAVCRERGLGLQEPVVEELIGRRGDRRAPPRPRAPAAQRRPAGRRRAAGPRDRLRARRRPVPAVGSSAHHLWSGGTHARLVRRSSKRGCASASASRGEDQAAAGIARRAC